VIEAGGSHQYHPILLAKLRTNSANTSPTSEPTHEPAAAARMVDVIAPLPAERTARRVSRSRHAWPSPALSEQARACLERTRSPTKPASSACPCFPPPPKSVRSSRRPRYPCVSDIQHRPVQHFPGQVPKRRHSRPFPVAFVNCRCLACNNPKPDGAVVNVSRH